MRVVLIKSGKTLDITKRCGNLTRSDNIDSFGQEVSFNYIFNRHDQYTQDVRIDLGDQIRLLDNTDSDFFVGLVKSFNDSYDGTIEFSVFDFGIGLGKNQIDIQFNGMKTSDAIKAVCKKANISCSVCDITETVTKDYHGETVGDVLKNLIGMATFKSHKKYRLEVRGNKVIVESYRDLETELKFLPAQNVASFDVFQKSARGKPSISGTIDELINHVKVVDENNKVISEAKDDESIRRFGEFLKIENNNKTADAKKILKELNQPNITISITALGDDKARSGRIVKMDGKKYIITNCTHNYGTAHTMSLELRDSSKVDASVKAVDPNEEKDSVGGFTGKAGDGVSKGHYKWPIPSWHGTPTTYPGHTNNARDFPAPFGSPITACDGGIVMIVQTVSNPVVHWSYGNMVKINHGGGRTTLYAHMSRITVSQGMKVSQGQTIGYVGSTGNSTGPHLHLEIVHNGRGIDPITLL